MTLWEFYDFLDGRGLNTIRSWLDCLPAQASAKIDARIVYMRAVAIWPEQYVSALRGWPDLFELRVVSSGVQYRPICCYGPGNRTVTIVLGATEKGKIPNRVLQNADDNRKLVHADPTRREPHVFRQGSTAG